MQRPDGSFHYYYDAEQDRFEPRRYNIVRHAGAALSLFDLYAATRDSRYLESARRAVRFLTARFRRARGTQGSYVLDFDGKAKLGANGLALVALARQIELDPKRADRGSATKLANLILAMQRKSRIRLDPITRPLHRPPARIPRSRDPPTRNQSHRDRRGIRLHHVTIR